MKTVLKTAPAKYPVSLDEAKDHLRIGTSQMDQDFYISSLIQTATAKTEQFLSRRLITQTWYLYLESWPEKIVLPFGNLQSVTSIKYTDSDGDQETWSASEYIVDTDTDPGEIVLGYGESYPTDTLYPSNPIVVEFVCGYGDNSTDIEYPILHAIKIAISELYEGLEHETNSDGRMVLGAFEHLLMPYRLFGAV